MIPRVARATNLRIDSIFFYSIVSRRRQITVSCLLPVLGENDEIIIHARNGNENATDELNEIPCRDRSAAASKAKMGLGPVASRNVDKNYYNYNFLERALTAVANAIIQ